MEFYATLGTACSRRETLEDMFRAGMTGLRLNLSHTSLKECRPLLESRFFPAARTAGVVPQLMIDLQGPELRVGQLPYPIQLREGKDVLLGDGGIPVPDKHGSGVGVINVHSRIQLMFGEQYGLEIYSEPDEGTRVVIHIPAIPYTKENAEQLEMQKYTQGRDVDEKE